MMIAKGLTLVSVLWNLAGNSEAPFLDKQPARAPASPVVAEAPKSAPSPEASPDAEAPEVAASAAPVASVAVVAPSPAAVAPAAVAPEMVAPDMVVPSVAAEPAPAPSVASSAPRAPLGQQKGPVITAMHITGWVAQLPVRLATLIDASKKAGLTAMIFEVKDVNGDLFFKMETSDGTNRFSEAIKNCHAAGLKVIARYCVFKDKASEEKNAAMRYGSLPGTNTRHKPWTNPQCKATQEYNLGLIKELAAMGVDEVNLDYIRFPSAPEGVHIDLPLPAKCRAIADFVRRVRGVLPKSIRLSMDVFGYVAWDENSARVGQRLEDLAPYVDGIYPMLYPDHFAKGDLGYKFPVEHPYEVIRRGCEAARAKKGMDHVTVVPWLQAFTLGSDTITYGPTELLAQMQGARDAGVPSWLAWNPRVNYTDLERALAMAKGKPDYTSFVKKYIPKKYQVAATDPDDAEKVAPQTTPAGHKGTLSAAKPPAAAPAAEETDADAAPSSTATLAESGGARPAAPRAPATGAAAPARAGARDTAPPLASGATAQGASSTVPPPGATPAPQAGASATAQGAPSTASVGASTTPQGASSTASVGANATAPGAASPASVGASTTPQGGAPVGGPAEQTAAGGVLAGTRTSVAQTARVAATAIAAVAAPAAGGAPGATAAATAPAPLASPGVYGDQPVEAPANPFAAAPGGADARSDAAVLGAAPATKGKSKKKAAADAAAKAKLKAKKPKKRPADGLEEIPDEGMDGNLYRYQPK